MAFTPPDHETVRAAIETLMDAVGTDLIADIAAAVDRAPIDLEYDGSQWPLRPDTTGTNRRCYWWGPSSVALPNTGTTTGGTRASAPGDRRFFS
jgi:hypothetical protein